MCNRISFFVCLFVLSLGQLAAQVSGLTRYGADSGSDTAYLDWNGGEVDFPRISPNGQILYYPPLVVLDSMRVISDHSAVFSGTVRFDGWSPVLSRGFEYGVYADFSSSERISVAGTNGSFGSEVSGPLPNRDYYVRPFAVNAYGTSYGTVASFHTAVGPVVLDTLYVSAVHPTSAEITVKIADNGGMPLAGEVVAFSDEDEQDTASARTLSNIAGAAATIPLTGLAPATDYFVRAVLTNGRFSDTLRLRVRTPTDLVLSIGTSGNPTVSLCTGGNTLTYRALLTGTDPHKPLYQYRWTSSGGTESLDEAVFDVMYDEVGTYTVTVDAFYAMDTLSATFTQVIAPIAGTSSFYVCTNEFLNTADATTTNITSIRWLDENRDTVATTTSVKLPTGYYTVECTDNYGCELSKEVYVGKKKLSCIVTDSVWSNESAHFEGGVWRVDSVSDHEGNWYSVTQIGNQCWTRQNLRTRHSPSTNEDLLAQGGHTRSMRYQVITSFVYDPENLPYYGGAYSWCGAMDIESPPNDLYFDFNGPVRGICPKGWHVPQYEETWEMVESVYNECCQDVDPYPPLRVNQKYGGMNLPLRDMFLESCYDSYTDPEYPEEVYDATHLSLLRVPPVPSRSEQFWIANCPMGAYVGYIFACSDKVEGIMVTTSSRRGNYGYVRCVRGNVE